MLRIFKKTTTVNKSCISVNEFELEMQKLLPILIASDYGKRLWQAKPYEKCQEFLYAKASNNLKFMPKLGTNLLTFSFYSAA